MALNSNFFTGQVNEAKGQLVTARLMDADVATYPNGHGDVTINWGSTVSDGGNAMKSVAADLIWTVPAGALLDKVEFYDGGTYKGFVSTTEFSYAGSGSYTLKDLTISSDNA